MIEIDGSKGEGGGQMLRTALGLSALTGEAFHLHNIRAGRDRPGLAAQHLACVRGLTEMCDASVDGAELGSTELTFEPQAFEPGVFRFDVGTAGSITLVLQACMLACSGSRAVTELDVLGGTNVRASPPVDYLEHILIPMLGRMGYRVEMELKGRGFYPQGGGEVIVRMSQGECILPLDLPERGRYVGIDGVCFTRRLPDHVAERICSTARKELVSSLPVRLRTDRGSGHSAGAGIFLRAEYEHTLIGAGALGDKGVSSEKVGEMAARQLSEEMCGGGTLDVHAADQLLPYMALAAGPSRFSVCQVSSHLETQVDMVRRFMDVKVDIDLRCHPFQVRVEPNRT